MALGCNICAIVKYVILLVIVVVLVIVYYTVGLPWLHGVNGAPICTESCQDDLYGHSHCSSRCT